MRTIFSRVSAMTAVQRDALSDQFDKASRIASAEPVVLSLPAELWSSVVAERTSHTTPSTATRPRSVAMMPSWAREGCIFGA